MKINLSSLMCLIDENEKQYSSLFFTLKKHVLNTSIQELNGTTNVVEDNKKDFEEELTEVKRLSSEISNTFNKVLNSGGIDKLFLRAIRVSL